MLTLKQRTHLEQRLRAERKRVLASLNSGLAQQEADTQEGRSGDVSRMPTHQADLGTETMQDELDASNLTRLSDELAEIEAALERLTQSPEQFGRDELTGEPIPLARLEVIPWARTCVSRPAPERARGRAADDRR